MTMEMCSPSVYFLVEKKKIIPAFMENPILNAKKKTHSYIT
jgi:hypothetical protein